MGAYVARPWRQPGLESPKMLNARELFFIALLDDVHEKNHARRTSPVLFIISYLQKPECVVFFYAYRHCNGRIGNMLKKDPETPL